MVASGGPWVVGCGFKELNSKLLQPALSSTILPSFWAQTLLRFTLLDMDPFFYVFLFIYYFLGFIGNREHVILIIYTAVREERLVCLAYKPV